MRCTMFSVAVPVLLLLGASPQEATVLGRRFKKIDKRFDYKVTILDEVTAVSLLKCNVECSVLPGCVALEYKRTTYHCTMYRHLDVTDESPVSVGRVSDDARRYAIPKTELMGYTTYPVEGGEMHLKRYFVRRTWDEALEMCRSDGATLVKTHTAEKLDIVRGLFDRTKTNECMEPWIGLRDTTGSNVYRWTDGSVATYTNWRKGEPSFEQNFFTPEDCVQMYIMQNYSDWNDLVCHKHRSFVCEI